ncbi:MAG: ABC transporter ATP-binding protein [Acidimicrobiales bacterium]|nr:ABC transporter ATP-binding protein [Acidimicrobiales bacterium]
MTTQPAVEVEDVSKRFRLYHDRNQSLKAAAMRGRRARYEEFWALKQVSFEVAEGSTFGLIGENGSGKSTLLKCMAQILRPDAGAVRTRGKVSALLELGAGFHPELSGRDNVFLNGAILGLSRKEVQERFDDIVGFAGLERFIDTPVKNYSSGMYVRLGFSVAINVEPDVLLVDEVLAVGDEQFQRRCAEKFTELRADGRTIVVVSHSMGSMQSMCDQVAWLDHGELKAVGPAHDMVDAYLGSVQMGGVPVGDTARWGSGEARIERVELIGADGAPIDGSIRTGDPVTFRLCYKADQPIERPTFGFALHTLDGVHVTGPRTADQGLFPDVILGEGTVELVVDRLLLLPGTYDLSCALHDSAGLHPYDARNRALRFNVVPGAPHEGMGGITSLGGEWHVDVLDAERRP